MNINGIVYNGNYYIEHNSDGSKNLGFEIYEKEQAYNECHSESLIDAGLIFRIKSVEEQANYKTVDAELDLNDLKTRIIKKYEQTGTTLGTVLNDVRDGYTIVGNLRSDTADVKLSKVTPYDVIIKLEKLFNCYIEFDNVAKTLTVIYMDVSTYEGNYITEQLNIISSEYTEDTYSIATRVYAYGKDDLTFSSINGGKEYVEDFSYTKDIIAKTVSDSSITTADALLAYAKKELASSCYPTQSFQFTIFNLSKLKSSDYSLKNLRIHSMVKYIDRKRKREVYSRVVKYKEYPMSHGQDVITLESIDMGTVSGIVGTYNAYKNTNEKFQEFKEAGHVVQDGNTIYICDTLPKESATNILRLDSSGLSQSNSYSGKYTTLIGIDQKTITNIRTSGATGTIEFVTGVWWDAEWGLGTSGGSASFVNGLYQG